jgi:hypothetical protein
MVSRAQVAAIGRGAFGRVALFISSPWSIGPAQGNVFVNRSDDYGAFSDSRSHALHRPGQRCPGERSRMQICAFLSQATPPNRTPSLAPPSPAPNQERSQAAGHREHCGEKVLRGISRSFLLKALDHNLDPISGVLALCIASLDARSHR